ncbi:hypothetical protein [Nitrosomonas sp. wSCUT-2]
MIFCGAHFDWMRESANWVRRIGKDLTAKRRNITITVPKFGCESCGIRRSPHHPWRAAAPLSAIVQPLKLDPLTVVDDPDFLARIASQKNLPAYVKIGLQALY